MKLVVGLGNPGPEYDGTRHNMGYHAVRLLAEKLGLGRFRRGLRGLASRGVVGGLGEVFLLLPTTYMNESGAAVRAAVRRRALAAEDLVVMHDDLDLPVGRVKVRLGGSSGGHRGVASIIDYLGTESFVRIKIGIGRPPAGIDPVYHVLRRPSPREAEALNRAASLAAEAARTVLLEGVAQAMNRFNAPDAAGPDSGEEGAEPAAGGGSETAR